MYRPVAGLVSVVFLLIAASPANSQGVSCNTPQTLGWANKGNNFMVAENWSPECEPGPLHQLSIAVLDGPLEVTNVDGVVAGLTVGPGIRLHGGHLTVLGRFSVATNHAAFDSHINTDVTAGELGIGGDGKLFLDPDADVIANGGGWSNSPLEPYDPVLNLGANSSLTLSGGTFTMSGTPRLLEGSATSLFRVGPGARAVADGPVTVHAATVEVDGTLVSPASRTLVLDETDLLLGDGGAVHGPGTVRLTKPTSAVQIEGTSSIAENGEIDVTAGEVLGTGTIGGNGRFRFSGGHLDGDLTTGPELSFLVSGAEPKFVEGLDPGTGRLTLKGPSSWGGAGAVHLKTSQVALRNEGTMTIEPAAFIVGDQLATLVNAGTVLTEGDGDRAVSNVAVESSGSLDLKGGRLSLRSLRQTDGKLWLRGGTLALVGNLPEFPAPALDLAGGELAGTGMLEAAVVSGGVVRPGDPDRHGAVGWLTVSGAFTQLAGGRTVVDAGNDGHDLLQASGPVALDGVLEVRTVGTPDIGRRFAVVRGSARTGAFSSLEGGDISADRMWLHRPVDAGADLEVIGKAVQAAPAPLPVFDTTPPVIGNLQVTNRKLRAALRRGLPLRATVGEAATLGIVLRRGSETVGRLTRQVGAGTATATVRFSRKARRKLRGLRRLRLTVRVTARDAAGLATTRSLNLTLRR